MLCLVSLNNYVSSLAIATIRLSPSCCRRVCRIPLPFHHDARVDLEYQIRHASGITEPGPEAVVPTSPFQLLLGLLAPVGPYITAFT